MMRQWADRGFEALSVEELYQLLQLRQEVFVLEQHCIYLDVDGHDREAIHLFAMENGLMSACCRLLPPGRKYQEASIGRVCTAPAHRGSGLGRELMRRAMGLAGQHYPGQGVRISAQQHLENFYRDFGFTTVSAPYDEDGIPHIEMLFTP